MTEVPTQAELKDLLARSIGPACHELRGPLAAAYGFSKMMEGSDLDATGQRYIAQVVRGCERLDSMLDSLARMGRAAAGRIKPDPAHVVVADALAEAVTGSRHEHDVTITHGDQVVAHVDHAWLVESVVGVLDALRYDDSLRATISWSHGAGQVVVEVRVHGELPGADTEVGAAALTLACARMRVSAMGGSIDSVDGGVDIVLPRP